MPEALQDLVVLMPVYEDREACLCLLQHLDAHIRGPYTVVVVDDGSRTNPFTPPGEVHPNRHLHLLRLNHNLGHQAAISVGLQYIAQHVSACQHVIVMDSDGEDAPQAINTLAASLEDHFDVAVASRGKRNDGLLFQTLYQGYKALFLCLTGQCMNFGNFMLLRGSAVQRLCTMNTLSRHLAGTVLASGLRVQKVQVNRGRRYAGRSKMNLRTLVRHGVTSLAVLGPVAQQRLATAKRICAGVALLCSLYWGGMAAAGSRQASELLPALAAVQMAAALGAAISATLSARLARPHALPPAGWQLEKPFPSAVDNAGACSA